MNINNEILKTFDTTNVWLSVDIIAKLKNISSRAVRLALKKENQSSQNRYVYQTEKVRGGKSYKILLSSIEEELQIKYIKKYYAELKFTNDVIKLETLPIKKEKIISEKQKNLALSKYDLVKSWERYREEQKALKISNRTSDKVFLGNYNTGLLYPDIYKTLNHVGIGAIYRWKATIDKTKDWTSLVGNYKYSSSGTYRTKLSEQEISIFLKILLSPNRFSIGKAISLTKHILKEKGVENPPNDITFKRYADWYKANNFDKWTLARDGFKALKDKVEPYILRDVSMLEVGQVLIADGHTLNFQVINPFTGRPTRATLIGFLDWKSGGLVGYDIMLEECNQSIMSALRNAILTMNHIPDYVYQDNGRAFKSKFFNGDKKFEELGFTGIYEKLGIKPVFATPYNARAKVIERFFLEFQESFEKLIPSYIGTSIENKPAYMNRNEKLHKQIHQEKANFIPTIEQALKLVEEWLKFRHSQPCPNNRTKSIQEMLDTIPKQNIDENILDDLMMAQEVKHIGRNGIRFLKADYFNDELYGIRGKAIVKYNLNDLSYIKVYSLKGEFLCRADRVTGTHPLASQMGDIKDIEDYKQKVRKQGQLRKRTIDAVKEHFKLEDVELIKAELIQNEIEKQEQIVEIKPIETKKEIKEKPQENYVQNRKRPLFKENYERYEWHMKNGCIGNEDRQWLSDYIKSEEYKTIYEE
ncbi:MAG: transposase [Candidatus Gastranaerophilales bacterium]|nr:transposase [Candidatus Gastranaerophilales bacterium]